MEARWVKFLSHELGEFLIAAVKAYPDRYAALLAKHSKTKGVLDDAAKAALTRFDEVLAPQLISAYPALTHPNLPYPQPT